MLIRKLAMHVVLGVTLMGSVLLTGCATDRAIVSQAQQFHGQLEPAVMTDAQLNDYLNAVGARIISAARDFHYQGLGPDAARRQDSEWMFGDEMRFHLVNSKTLNAFTTGGNHMYIYNELFQQSATEDALAAVMAHEYAHVYARHVHRTMNRQYAILGAAAAAAGAGYLAGGDSRETTAGIAGGGALLIGQLVGMHYSRQDEEEADRLGFEFYIRAGWDPERFGDFFQAMIDKGYDTGPEFLSGHPSLSSRRDSAQRWAAELPPQAAEWRTAPVADARQFARLQARARQIGANMPDDQTLARSQQLLQAISRSCLTPAIHEDQKQAEIELLYEVYETPDGGEPAPRRRARQQR